VDLGFFYVDNASKKRWYLRFDDPKALAQIDAVFVTVEPNGGKPQPSNKPLLFAYLRIETESSPEHHMRHRTLSVNPSSRISPAHPVFSKDGKHSSKDVFSLRNSIPEMSWSLDEDELCPGSCLLAGFFENPLADGNNQAASVCHISRLSRFCKTIQIQDRLSRPPVVFRSLRVAPRVLSLRPRICLPACRSPELHRQAKRNISRYSFRQTLKAPFHEIRNAIHVQILATALTSKLVVRRPGDFPESDSATKPWPRAPSAGKLWEASSTIRGQPGQSDPRVKFLAHGHGYAVFLSFRPDGSCTSAVGSEIGYPGKEFSRCCL